MAVCLDPLQHSCRAAVDSECVQTWLAHTLAIGCLYIEVLLPYVKVMLNVGGNRGQCVFNPSGLYTCDIEILRILRSDMGFRSF